MLWKVRLDIEEVLPEVNPTLSFETRSRLLKSHKFLGLRVDDEQIVALLLEGVKHLGIYSYKTIQALLDYYVLTTSSCRNDKAEEPLDHLIYDVP